MDLIHRWQTVRRPQCAVEASLVSDRSCRTCIFTGVKWFQLVLALPFMAAFGVAGHALLARGVKAVLWSWSPLATGEPEAASYQRQVYHTADPAMLQVVGAAAGAGVLMWLGMATGFSLLGWLGVLAVPGAVALDVQRWERVAVSAHHLWFQRGWGSKVHQVVLENIRDLSVEESEAEGGFTLRHGRRNRLVRLSVRMHDKRVVALPKTDAHGGLDAVEAVANMLRQRLQQIRERDLSRRRPAIDELPPPGAPDSVGPDDNELQRALARLRAQAAAPRPAKAAAKARAR